MSSAGVVYVMQEMARMGLQVRAVIPYSEYSFVKCTGTGKGARYEPVLLEDYFSPQMVEIVLGLDAYWWGGLIGCATKHEWLYCNGCNQPQLVASKQGAPSQKKRCMMTVDCKGILRRIRPEVVSIEMPPRKRMPKVKVEIDLFEDAA